MSALESVPTIYNATSDIDAGRGVIRHRVVSDGSDGACPLCRSHSARTEMFSADAIANWILLEAIYHKYWATQIHCIQQMEENIGCCNSDEMHAIIICYQNNSKQLSDRPLDGFDDSRWSWFWNIIAAEFRSQERTESMPTRGQWQICGSMPAKM